MMERLIVGKDIRKIVTIPANEEAQIRARWAQFDNAPKEPPPVAIDAKLAAIEARLAALEKR
jgi:hypothetical protein